MASEAYGIEIIKKGFNRKASIILLLESSDIALCIPQEGQYVPVSNHHGHLGTNCDV